MSAEGANHVLLGRPLRFDRQGILTLLRSVSVDRHAMLEMRRFLAEELSRSAIHRMRDETVIELLAEHYLRGTFRFVEVRPHEPHLEGFTVEGADTSPVLGPENKAGDLKPSPIVPGEYPRLARVESDSVIDATLKLVAKLAKLLFSTFGLDKRPSSIARQYKLTSAEEGGGIMRARNKLDATLDSLRHAGSTLKPTANLPDVYLTVARSMAIAPPAAIPGLVNSLFNLAYVPLKNKRSPDDPEPDKGPKFSDLEWSVDRVEVGKEVTAKFTYSGLAAGRVVSVTFSECNADGSRKRIVQEMIQVDAESGVHSIQWKRDPELAKADLADDQAEGDTGPVEYRFTVESRGTKRSGESGPLWLTNTVTISLGEARNDTSDKPTMVVVLADAEKEHRTLSKDGKATFEKVLVGPLKVWVETPKFTGLAWSQEEATVDVEVEASFSYENAYAGMKVEVLVHDGVGRLVKQLQTTLDDESGQAKVSFTRTKAEALEDVDLIEGDEDAPAVEYRFVVAGGGTETEPSPPLPLARAKFTEPKWSVDRVEVGQEVTASFEYMGLEAGQDVTVTIFECNADGSRKEIAQEIVQVDAESGAQKIPWKRNPEQAKADAAEDVAEGDTGPVEYRFTVQSPGAKPSDESGPLWLTNTVTINLGDKDDDSSDKPTMLVVLADAEKEHRTLSKDGKATFEKVLVGPLKVWIETPTFSNLEWSKSKAAVDTAVQASFSYEKAAAGVKVDVLVQDGTGRVIKQMQVTLAGDSGQSTVSFTRTEAEAQEDMDIVELDEDTVPIEYRFVVAAGGVESEPSSPLHLTHKVVLPVEDFNDGEPLPDEMEPVLVDAEGTEYRAKISGDEASFEGVVCGPTTKKLESKK